MALLILCGTIPTMTRSVLHPQPGEPGWYVGAPRARTATLTALNWDCRSSHSVSAIPHCAQPMCKRATESRYIKGNFGQCIGPNMSWSTQVPVFPGPGFIEDDYSNLTFLENVEMHPTTSSSDAQNVYTGRSCLPLTCDTQTFQPVQCPRYSVTLVSTSCIRCEPGYYLREPRKVFFKFGGMEENRGMWSYSWFSCNQWVGHLGNSYKFCGYSECVRCASCNSSHSLLPGTACPGNTAEDTTVCVPTSSSPTVSPTTSPISSSPTVSPTVRTMRPTVRTMRPTVRTMRPTVRTHRPTASTSSSPLTVSQACTYNCDGDVDTSASQDGGTDISTNMVAIIVVIFLVAVICSLIAGVAIGRRMKNAPQARNGDVSHHNPIYSSSKDSGDDYLHVSEH